MIILASDKRVLGRLRKRYCEILEFSDLEGSDDLILWAVDEIKS